MSNVPQISLKELIRVEYGSALKEEDRNSKGPYAVYGSSGRLGNHTEALVKEPTIVIGRKGSVGSVTYAPDGGWPIDTAFYTTILEPTRIDIRFLFYALSSARLGDKAITTSIPGLSRDEIYRKKISLPPLAEQRHIAAILDKANSVQRKTALLETVLAEILEAAYQSLAGPKNTEYKRWPLVKIEDLAKDGSNSLRTGPFGSALKHSEFVEDGIAVLGIDNAVKNRFDWQERRFITEEKYRSLRRYTVHPEDVIVTIMGTTGRSAVVPVDVPRAISTKHLAVITLNRKRAHPEFLSKALVYDPGILRQIVSATRGAIMSGLNLGIIRRLELRCPPIAQQDKFVDVVFKTMKMRDRMMRAANNSKELFATLANTLLK